MEKVYPEIETTGFYRLDSCILSNNDTFQFYEPDSILLTRPGKYEFLIGEEEKNIPYLTSEQIFPHQCNDILIKVRDNWIEWENMISTYNLKGIKSKSGKKIVRFEIYFLGFEEKQFDVIVNPRENEVFRGEYNNNVLRHPVVLITSWYPMNFSQLWNYTSLDCEPENYETKNKLDMKAKFIGVTKLCITIKYYNKISQFVFCNFSRSENFDYSNLVNKVFHLDNNKIFVDKWDGEVILYEYFEYSTDKDIYFNAEQYKIIIVKSKWGISKCLVHFPNYDEFVFENGSSPEKFYLPGWDDLIIKVKPKSGQKSLRLDSNYYWHDYYDTVMVISNDFDLKLKFPNTKKKILIIFESIVESTITFFDKDKDGFNFTEVTGTLFYFNNNHTGVFSWKNLTELPPNTIKKSNNGYKSRSIYESGIEILMEGDLKKVRYENKLLEYYVMNIEKTSPLVYAFADNLYIQNIQKGHFYTFNSTRPCDIVIFVRGLPGGFYNPQYYKADINYLRSIYPGYYITSDYHNISLIYSYYPFSTTVKHNVSEIKLRLQTNNGQEQNIVVGENETYSIQSINLMIIHHPNAYVEFSQIIFDDPNVNYQGKYSQAAFSNGAWIAIPVRTPQPTTIVPARTSEASSSKSNSSPSGDENDNEEEPDKSKSTSGKLGTGAIVGIVIGILIAAVLVAVAVIFILKSRPKRTDTSDMDIQFANIV